MGVEKEYRLRGLLLRRVLQVWLCGFWLCYTLSVAAAPRPCQLQVAAQTRWLLAPCSVESVVESSPLKPAARMLTVTLDNPSATPQDFIVALGVPDALYLSFTHEVAGQRQAQHEQSRLTPFDARLQPQAQLSLPLRLMPGVNTLILHYRLHANGRLWPQLWSAAALSAHLAQQAVFNGVLFGLLLGVLAVVLVWRFLGGRLAYMAYAAVVLSEGLMLGQIEGYWFAWWWPNAPLWNAKAPLVFACCCLIGHAVFAMRFLQLAARYPRLNRAHIAWLGAACALLLAVLGAEFAAWIEVAVLGLTLCYAALALMTLSVALRHRLPGSGWYALGSGALAVFNFVLFPLAAAGWGVWPALGVFVYPKLGMVLESLCFCFALLFRVAQQRRDEAALRVRRLAEAEALLRAETARHSAQTRLQEQGLQMAATSHDLLQPLASLRFALAALPKTAENAGVAAHLAQTVSYADGLLKAVICQARDEVSVLHTQLCVGEVLARVARDHQPMAHAQGLRLRWVYSSQEVSASALVLERILHNLLGNALRYTVRGGVLFGVRRRAAGLELQVFDSGPGIVPEALGRLQRAFVQGDLQNPQAAGFGLGLFIVHTLCQQCGYRFTVRSVLQKGTCFSVLIPAENVK